jgi:hypothetical protein
MKSRRQTTFIAGGCLVISLIMSILILRRADQIRPQATLDEVL